MSSLVHISALLAQIEAPPAPPEHIGYRPFLMPLPLWNYWYLMVFPLCLGVSIVYKSIKCVDLSDVPKQAAWITLWILGGMAVAAEVLSLIVKVF